LSRQSRNLIVSLAILAIVSLVGVARWRAGGLPAVGGESAETDTRIVRGGTLVISVRGEPRTFNRYVARDQTSDLIATLTQAKLVRVNRITQEVEPWLAERWSSDGLHATLTLRSNVAWSDGQPFTADDVLFSFEAVYDEKSHPLLADSLTVNGKRLQVSAPDARTIVVTFPSPFAPGVRLLDNLPIYPRHKLGGALVDGTFATAWNTSTPPSDLAGLGPFVIREYVPGQRIVFARNPRYWRTDAAGEPLPYLDGITMDVVTDQGADLLRFESGQADLTMNEARLEDYASLKRAADAGRIKLLDLGVGLDADSFWFNLKPNAFAGDPRAAWLQNEAFRRAVSMAVNRQLFADTVFLGAGVPVYGPVTPANRKWYDADAAAPHYDMEGAKRQLASLGLTDRTGDGLLEDQGGRPVRFTLITQKGQTSLERGAAVIRDELKKLGVVVDVAAIEGNALIQQILSARYDAVYFGFSLSDTDPTINADFWPSTGGEHFWDREQKTPATPWEAMLDDLFRRLGASVDMAERKRIFDEMQRIFIEHQPMIYFASPRVFVASTNRVGNVTPTVVPPRLLWSPDTITLSAR